MSLGKANIAGLTFPHQRSEMKCILAGTWPPLKPLPVFKYETSKYRATIDFDKLRGEWVCRKTSFPSNKVQELRGELREITLALPHEEAEELMEGAEHQEPELEKDTNRRLQAIRDWTTNYENGARYLELRNYLSENQRNEIDGSLRLSLTARQLQFSSKNIASVFDALSTAGGRFATLIELAKRNKSRQETAHQAQPEGAVQEAERAMDQGELCLGISPGLERVLNNHDPSVRDPEAAAGCNEADEPPAVAIKNIFPEQYETPSAERMADTASEQFANETSQILDVDSFSLVKHPRQEEDPSSTFADFVAQMQTGKPSEDHSAGSSSRFPVLEISAFHLTVFTSLFLFAVIAFAVGLTMGRGPLGSRLQDFPKSMFSFNAKSPPLPDRADQAISRSSTPPAASSEPASTNRLNEQAPSEEKPKENTPGSEHFAEARSADSNSAPATASKPSAEPVHSSKANGEVSSAPVSPTPSPLNSATGAAPHLPRVSTILVNVPGRGSQPFRVSFPEKTIAATPSLAMSSQLSVLVSPEARPAEAHRPARLEAGELVSFVSPHYPKLGYRYGLAQVIRVRATIGPLGQVRDVKFLSGSTSLLPATIRAIRQWRYKPTLLDKRPVQAQQDLTIEFRPLQYSSQASTRHPTQKLVTVK